MFWTRIRLSVALVTWGSIQRSCVARLLILETQRKEPWHRRLAFNSVFEVIRNPAGSNRDACVSNAPQLLESDKKHLILRKIIGILDSFQKQHGIPLQADLKYHRAVNPGKQKDQPSSHPSHRYKSFQEESPWPKEKDT